MAKIIRKAQDAETPDIKIVEVKLEKPKKVKVKKSKNNFDLIEDYLMDNYAFRLNIISVEMEYTQKGQNQWELLNENNLYYHLYKAGYKGFQNIVQVLMKNDYTRQQFNPVQSYFNNLPVYDPSVEPDYIKQFTSFIQVEEKEKALFEVQFKKAIVRTAACGIHRIKFNKQALILQGKQDDGKSSLIRHLVPETLGSKYFTDSFDPEDKDSEKRLATCFIINIDEMADLSRRDVNKIKSKMTLENVKMRLPYDARDSDLPRIATFFGTTNEQEFLTDVTGNVRWMVFKVLNINHDNGGQKGYMSVDMDRFWAQAMYLLNNKFDFKMSKEELEEMDTINRNYQVTSPEEEYITRYFDAAYEGEKGGKIMTCTEMIDYIKAQHPSVQFNSIAFGKAMTKWKFERGQRMKGAYQVKGYWVKLSDVQERPETTPARQNIKEQYAEYQSVHNIIKATGITEREMNGSVPF